MKCYSHPEKDAIGTCSRCGKGVCEECNVHINGKYACKECASAMASNCQASTQKDPILALILSFFFPGLGQLYLGNTNHGLVLVLCGIVAWVLMSVCIGLFIYIGLWIYSMYDAYTSAEKFNRGELVFATH